MSAVPMPDADDTLTQLHSLLRGADSAFIKRLALNDWQWVHNKDAHQGGFYIPKRERDSGFFPVLKESIGPRGGTVREATLTIHWVQTHESREARLVNYPSKGEETHLTGVAKEPLLDLVPTSTLVVVRSKSAYSAMIVPAETQAAEWLRALFELPADYHSLIGDPSKAFGKQEASTLDFAALAWHAFAAGRFDEFAKEHAVIPDTYGMARWAQEVYLAKAMRLNLNPFELESPGDVLRTLSQDIEWGKFQEFERKSRSLELVRLITSRDGGASVENLFKGVIRNFPEINRVLLSSAQQRKSRAGYSLEHHLRRMLEDGKIPHEYQVVLKEKNRRPDFILPSKKLFSDTTRNDNDALILSGKTSIRERWNQVIGEKTNCDLFLATFDGSVRRDTLREMGKSGVRLVVPESLKHSKETVYADTDEVISFKMFFYDDIRGRRFPIWKRLGVLSA